MKELVCIYAVCPLPLALSRIFAIFISAQHTYTLILFNMSTTTATALLVLVISIIHTSTHALNILVVGGSGRVGGSTVRWIDTLSSRQKLSTKLTVGGRKHHVRIQSLSTYLNMNMVPHFSSSLKSVISSGGKEQSHPIRCRLSSVRY